MARRRLPKGILTLAYYRAAFLNSMMYYYKDSLPYLEDTMHLMQEYYISCISEKDSQLKTVHQVKKYYDDIQKSNSDDSFYPGEHDGLGSRVKIYMACRSEIFIEDLNNKETVMLFNVRKNLRSWLFSIGMSSQDDAHDWLIWSGVQIAYLNMPILGIECEFLFSELECMGSSEMIEGKLTMIEANRMFRAGGILDKVGQSKEPLPPQMPPYRNQGEVAYKLACSGMINEYLNKLDIYFSNTNNAIYTPKQPDILLRQLRWLIWRLREGWAYEKIATEEVAWGFDQSFPEKSAFYEGTGDLARLLFVRLNSPD